QHDTVTCGRANYPAALCLGGCHRLLEQDVVAKSGEGLRRLGVLRVEGRDDHRVRQPRQRRPLAPVVELSPGGDRELAGQAVPVGGPWRGNRDDSRWYARLGCGASVSSAPAARTDDRDGDQRAALANLRRRLDASPTSPERYPRRRRRELTYPWSNDCPLPSNYPP